MTTMRRLLPLLAAFAAAFHSPLSNALQVIEPVEGQNSFIKVSAKELTRVAVENGKIRNIIFTDGELSIEKDEERGQVFLRPLLLQKPINARFITSSGRTYSIVMQAVDIPQEDVILRDSGLRAERQPGAIGRTPGGYEKAIRALVTAMASEEFPTNIDVKQANEEIALWDGTRFILTSVYTDRGMVGEKYRLYNTGTERIRVVEQELFRKGVVAIAIENMTLDPGQSTNVLVIRGN